MDRKGVFLWGSSLGSLGADLVPIGHGQDTRLATNSVPRLATARVSCLAACRASGRNMMAHSLLWIPCPTVGEVYGQVPYQWT